MKRITATLLALVTGLSLLMVPVPAQANAGVAITLATDKASYSAGEPVTLTVSTADVADLYGATVDVYYDTTLLQLDQGNTTAASVITNGLDSAHSYNRVIDDPSSSRVSLIALRLGNQQGVNVTGTGTLGTIKFTAAHAGSFTFTARAAGGTPAPGDVVVQMADHNGTDIAVAPGATAPITITGSAGQGTLSGTVNLDGWLGQNKGGAIVTIQGQNLTATTDASGAFTISNIPAGTYTVYIRRTSFLTKQATAVVITDAQTTTKTWTLTPGNISDSAGPVDRVFLEDLLALAQAWGTTSNPAADLNGDGAVNNADLIILQAHWGETGADY